MVASDYKNDRVGDPSVPLSDKQAKKLMKYVKDFLDRAVEKYADHKRRRAPRDTHQARGMPSAATHATESPRPEAVPTREDDAIMSDTGPDSAGSPGRKRKRENGATDSPSLTPSDGPLMKRLRDDELDESSTPPPPPPPPESVMEDVVTAEQQALREQEEALMRENEEAERLEEEANRARGMGDALAERSKSSQNALPDQKVAAQKQEVLSH